MYKNKVWKESRYFCEKYKNNLALGVDPCYQGYHQQRVENDTTISEDDNQFNKIDIVKLSFGFFRREIRSRFFSLIKLLHRSFSICCNLKTFHFEIDLLKLFSWRAIIPRISLIRVLNHFLISCTHLKLLYLKEMFLLSCPFREVLCFKFERSFKNYWRLVTFRTCLQV